MFRLYLCIMALALIAAPAQADVFESVAESSTLSMEGKWRINFDFSVKKGKGQANGFEAVDYDDSQWKFIPVGNSWENAGYQFNGIGWYRTKVKIPASWKGRAILMRCGLPDDGAETYFNGKSLGMTKRFGDTISYVLPNDSINYGAVNQIAIRVWDWYKGGGLARGPYRLDVIQPFAKSTQATKTESMALKLFDSMPKDVISDKRVKWGWRDGGTANTRPKLAMKALDNHANTLEMNVWFPNSSGEFVDFSVDSKRNGKVWDKQGFDYVQFWVKTTETEGEMHLKLQRGNQTWGKRGPMFFTRFWVKPGDWQRVILPFSAFNAQGKRGRGPTMHSASIVDTISIGYRNHELQRPGKVYFRDFEVGKFDVPHAGLPISLEGLWNFKRDDKNTDGSSIDWKNPDQREGIGVTQEWFSPSKSVDGWGIISLPGVWETQGHQYDGLAWYKQQVTIPESWRGLPLTLRMGKPDDRGTLYFNGKPVVEVKKYGPMFTTTLSPDLIKYGAANTIAVRIADFYHNGGMHSGSFDIGPVAYDVAIRKKGGQWGSLDTFDMGVNPASGYDLKIKLFKGLVARDDVALQYRLVSCFHRTIATGAAKVGSADGAYAEAIVSLNAAQSRALYNSEWFDIRGLVVSEAKGPILAFNEYDKRLTYRQRDNLALPALPETYEETPYGKLKLVDVIDCAKDPWADEHPYKEGGIRHSWVGRRAYATWQQGVSVKNFDGRSYREANNNEFFMYRVGRGKLEPHKAYVLRVLFPDNAKRYQVMHIKTGRNYQGTGFRTGAGADDPLVPFPQTKTWQWYDHIVFNDDVTYGHEGSRKVSSEHGFWVAFHDNGRCYTPQYDAGPAAAEIRLYEIEDIPAHYPTIRYPESAAKRVLMMDWERKPEIPATDMAHAAKLLGINAVSMVIQKWAYMGFWDTKMGWAVPEGDAWNSATRPGGNNRLRYQHYLQGTKDVGITFVPRIEYGGSPNLPKEARVINAEGKQDSAGRFAQWGGNILHPATRAEASKVIEELFSTHIKDNPQLGGLLLRMRNERIKVSYGQQDVALFCKETKRDMPKLKGKALSQWAARTNKKAYHAWWHEKRRDWHKSLLDQLKSYRPDLALYFYNWDPDGWNMGPSSKVGNKPQDWTDYYNVDKAHDFYNRKKKIRNAIKPADYVNMVDNFSEPHWQIKPALYDDMKDFHLFAPVHWNYLADNEKYINYFRVGDRLAVCNMFNYEEKGRWNIQGDNYQSSEMTPGGSAFSMADEVLSVFHGDPIVITETLYTFGRGFAHEHRKFAQAYLALPATSGKVIKQGHLPNATKVRVRQYTDGAGTRIGVTHIGYTSADLAIRIPDVNPTSLVDAVTGKDVPFKKIDTGIEFQLASDAMQLNSVILK